MTIVRHRQFKKHYQKRISPHPKLDRQFETRLRLFLKDPYTPLLADHGLTGSLKGLRSFSVSGDIRVIYLIKKGDLILFDIGTHNQVY